MTGQNVAMHLNTTEVRILYSCGLFYAVLCRTTLSRTLAQLVASVEEGLYVQR